MGEAQGPLTAIVLAAGRGKRMRSELPKVLHTVAGRPLVAHVLEALRPLPVARRVVVTSQPAEPVEAAVRDNGFAGGIDFVIQDAPLGTADAVRAALRALGDARGRVLVVQGGSPLLQASTLARLLAHHADYPAAATLLTAHAIHSSRYGRVVRRTDGTVERIVEERDATDQERRIDEINAGVYVFHAARLVEVIDRVDRDNEQREYYLPDVVALLREQGATVAAVTTDEDEVLGVKTRADLARAGAVLRTRIAQRWMDEGVSIVDPSTTYIDATVSVGRDATILPFTFLEGATTVGERAEVGPHARIVSSEVGDDAAVSHSVVVDSIVGDEASVGPFASLRPGTRLEPKARVGTFVETKNTTLGEGSKANHLSYLGDAEIGRNVNVGAGSITCNWDGRSKHKTVIEDEAYISSDTMLVAPTRIGKRAATGAGAVVKGDVPDEALAVGVPARIVEGKGNKMPTKTTDNVPERGE